MVEGFEGLTADVWESLSDEEKAAYWSALRDVPRVYPSVGPQSAAYISEADFTGYGGSAGGGKRQPLDSVVKTPFCDKRIGDLLVGDVVCDVFGSGSRVVLTHPIVDSECYRLSFSDGTSVLCDPEHLWLVWSRNRGLKRGGVVRHGVSGGRVLPAEMILRDMEAGIRYRVPLSGPVWGGRNKFKFPPYSLGVFLGDGSMSARGCCNVGVHVEDMEILEALMGELDGFSVKSYAGRPSFVVGCLSTRSQDYVRLREMGLVGKRSWEKFLPKSVYFESEKWRWSLLQGLMDTDGWVEEKRCAYYATTAPGLRDGVADLARSLGCFVTVNSKIPKFEYRGEVKDGRRAWTLRIKSATPAKLFRLKRKRAIAARLKHQSLAKEITDIESVGKQEQRCITVSCPSGLYLTNDYTVTHNTSLACMLAVQRHFKTVIFRADKNQMTDIVNQLVEFHGTDEGLNNQGGRFRLSKDGHEVEWGGLRDQVNASRWQGRPHDLVVFDEATEIPFAHILYVLTWMRDAVKGSRTRVLMTFNPPGGVGQETAHSGRWVVDFFAPWLDPKHENPAKPGELRWFYRDSEGVERECSGPDDVIEMEFEVDGRRHVELARPESRTFIPARVDDNPYLRDSNYKKRLLNLPEPLRSQMLFGDFSKVMSDPEKQVIPTAWIDEAMERWSEDGRRGDMTAMGVDVARGGPDKTVLACRHGYWWDKLLECPGTSTPNGHQVAGQVFMHLRDSALVCIDSIGVGAAPFDILQARGVDIVAVDSSRVHKSHFRRVEPTMRFLNLRAALWWLLRKVLNPDNNLLPSLPPDRMLRAELIATMWDIGMNGSWKVMSKADIKEDLGRSPDRADAVVYSLMGLMDEVRDGKLKVESGVGLGYDGFGVVGGWEGQRQSETGWMVN